MELQTGTPFVWNKKLCTRLSFRHFLISSIFPRPLYLWESQLFAQMKLKTGTPFVRNSNVLRKALKFSSRHFLLSPLYSQTIMLVNHIMLIITEKPIYSKLCDLEAFSVIVLLNLKSFSIPRCKDIVMRSVSLSYC